MSLRERVLHSLKWLAAVRLGGQMIAWMITLVVIRILEPSDYGLMAIANILIGFANLFREMGLYSAMVQKKDLTDRQIEQSFGLLIVVNTLIYGLLLLLAPGIAYFFDEPRLIDIIWVLGLQFPLAAVGVVQNAMLSRHMAFKRTSFVNLAVILSNGLTTLGCALAGFGVWALVWGSLVGELMRSAGLIVAARHWCRPRFSSVDMGSMIRFGSFVTTSRVLWYIYQQSDKAIIGKVLGKEALGQYAVAMQLASMPLQKFSGLMNQVSLAAYSTVQSDAAAIRFYYCKAVRSIAFFSFPVFWGISCVSPELVNVVLGSTWQPAIIPLMVLSLIMPLRMVTSAGGGALEAIGKPQVGTVNVLITFLVMPPAFLVGVQWGLVGVSMAWLLVFPVQFFIRLWRSLPYVGVTLNEYLKSLGGPAMGAFFMYAAVAVARVAIVEPYLSPVTGLVFLIFTGALSYMLYMWCTRREECLEVLQLIKKKEQSAQPA